MKMSERVLCGMKALGSVKRGYMNQLEWDVSYPDGFERGGGMNIVSRYTENNVDR